MCTYLDGWSFQNLACQRSRANRIVPPESPDIKKGIINTGPHTNPTLKSIKRTRRVKLAHTVLSSRVRRCKKIRRFVFTGKNYQKSIKAIIC